VQKKRPAKKQPTKKPVIKKPVIKKATPKTETPLRQVPVRFTGKLNPSMRAFSPTLRKLMLEDFQSVSVGQDRAIVRNPKNVGTDPETIIRSKLEKVGIVVKKVEPIVKSELNPDNSFRVHYG
jgi:hypothetical protein